MYRDNKPFDLSPYDHPDIYPGPRPHSSFVFWQGKAHRIEAIKGLPLEHQVVHLSNSDHILGSLAFNSFETRKVSDFLGDGMLKEKVPVVAYGSNVCLAQLRYKFNLRPSVDDFMLCIKGAIIDSEIVYGPFLAPYGSLPGVIAPMEGATTEVWITFMDKKQLELINATEKGYELREHSGQKMVLESGEVFEKVYAYFVPEALLWEGQMIRFPDIPGTSPLPAIWQADMLNEVREKIDFMGTREEFIHLLRWDFAFREQVELFLKKHACEFDHADWKPLEKIASIGEMNRSFK
ncbi:hypothetical protein JOC95_002619 [Bacillus tianshenii]|uniref:RNA ligase domain-containing protein n=1 Tax=Sutcliffiella tianshenii TaxID=1463404 RepID=A0ABS2P1L5_9BACI|nr:hypothetical protein [Bacillus tianshenii]MBM7620764.1 hypothetical protein [Bacillus tianshenii]